MKRTHWAIDFEFRKFSLSFGAYEITTLWRYVPIHFSPVWTAPGGGWNPKNWHGWSVGVFAWSAYVMAWINEIDQFGRVRLRPKQSRWVRVVRWQ
jgi:hypothetical protein